VLPNLKNRVLDFDEGDGFDRLYILQAAQLAGIKQTMPEPRLNELLKICQGFNSPFLKKPLSKLSGWIEINPFENQRTIIQ